jgi:prepilin-type N-terminal cleavage/methylation domain-containing protein
MATMKQDEGFTLIEVLIVIVILGVLSTVVVAAVGGARSDAEESSCSSDAYTLATAAEAFFAQRAATVIPDADGTPDGYEQTLVAEQFLRTHSILHDLDERGRLVQVAASPCTV